MRAAGEPPSAPGESQAPHAPAQMHHNPCEPCPEAGPQQPAASPGLAPEEQKTTEAGCSPSARGTVRMPPPPPKPGAPSPAGLPAGLTSRITSSSQRDAMTGAPSRLMSGSDGGSDDKQDEYLLRLLRKGAPAQPPAQQQQLPPPAQQPPPQQQQQGAPPPALHPQQHPQQQQEVQGFRAPGPTRRASSGSGSLVPAGPTAAAMLASPSRMLMRQTSLSMASPSGPAGTHTNGNGATVPSMSQPTANTNDQAVPASRGGAAAARAGAAAPAAAAAAARAAAQPLPPNSQPPLELGSGAAPAGEAAAAATDEFAVTRRLLGDDTAFSVRNTMVRQQVTFLEQLYDLHRAIAIQKLLMQNCPEVEQVMGEAMRLMSSVGSQHGSGSGRGSKRGHRSTPNGGGATVPGSGSGDPSSFRPDSQFAAVPQLPGVAQTAGGSGDEDDGGSGDANGSGSGQNGSGGGSTSPQPGAAGRPLPPPMPPYMHLAHTAVATPSGASQARGTGWQCRMPVPMWVAGQQEQQQQAPPAARGLPPVPAGPPQMAPWVGQDAGLAAVGRGAAHAPSHAPAAAAKRPAAPAPVPAAAAAAPPRQQQQQQQAAGLSGMPAPMSMPAGGPFAAAPGSGGGSMLSMLPSMVGAAGSAGNDPLSWWYQNYYGAASATAAYQQPQMGGSMSLAQAQAAAQAAAALMPPPAAGGCAAAQPATGGTAGVAATKWWHDPQLTFGPAVDTEMLARRAAATAAGGREGPEVQSAPEGQPKRPRPLPSAQQQAQAAAAAAAVAPSQRRGGLYSEGRLHLKRKSTAEADEASSGTTGHAFGHSHEHETAGTPRSTFKRQESLRARSARGTPGGRAAALDVCGHLGGGAQDETAAEVLLAIGKQ